MDFDIQGRNKSPVNTEGWLYTKMLVVGLYMGLVFTLVHIWILLIFYKYLFFMIRRKQWLFTSYLQCSCSFLCKWKLLASHTMIFKHWSFHIFFFYSESLDVKEGNKIRHPLSQILAVITDSHRPTFRLHNKALLLSNSILAASPFRANAQKISIDQKGKISSFRRPATWGKGEFVSKNQFQRFCLPWKLLKGSLVQSLSCVRLFVTPWIAGLHARLPCLSPTPRAYSNSSPSSRWCHPTTSSSVVPFSSHLQSFLASGSFPVSQFFLSGGQIIGVSASASVLPMNIQD